MKTYLTLGSHLIRGDQTLRRFVYDLGVILAQFDRPRANHFLQRLESLSDAAERSMSNLIHGMHGIIYELNRHVPPFTYFGPNLTDPNNYGVWIDLERLSEAERAGRLVQTGSYPVKGHSTWILELGEEIKLHKRKPHQHVWTFKT